MLNQQLVLQSNNCGCVIYECTFNSEGTIVWKGSAFDCPSVDNVIILLVLDQLQGFKTQSCNDGAIKAKRNNYTSQLIITDSSLSGSSIQYIHENGTLNPSVIGEISLPTINTSSGNVNSHHWTKIKISYIFHFPKHDISW